MGTVHSPHQHLGFPKQSLQQWSGLALLTILLAGGAGFLGWHLRGDNSRSDSGVASIAAADPPLSVDVITVRQQSLAYDRTLTGTIETEESVTLTSRIMGQVQQLTVKEGDRVAAGQIIARIDVSDMQAQQNQAQAGVNVAKSGYQTAQAQLHQSQAQLSEAEAELAEAQLHQKRTATLHQEGAVSRSLLDQANTRVAVLRARIQQIHAGIRQAETTITQAQAHVQQAQAGVDQVAANLEYGTVVAPFDGVVTRKQIEIGAMAGPGQAIVTVENVDRLRFSVEVPEQAIAEVRPGQAVTVKVDAINRSLGGTVSQVIPTADPIARNFTVKISLPAVPSLLPGMFGRLQLSSTRNQTALLVPTTAIVKRTGITGVYQVKQDKAIFQVVTLGAERHGQVEVFAGLKAGDRIMAHPPTTLPADQPVTVSPRSAQSVPQ